MNENFTPCALYLAETSKLADGTPLEVTRCMRLLRLGLVFLLACGGSSHSVLDAGPGDGASGDGPSGGGGVCGGVARTPCSATQFCDYADNGCGIGEQTGTCKPRPDLCPVSATGAPGIVATPTCACDGMIYGSQCEAARAGVDINEHGTCDVPAGRFACGTTQCFLASQYCKRQPHTGGPDTFSCVALPAECSRNPGCGCLASEACSNLCGGSSAAGMTLTCTPTP